MKFCARINIFTFFYLFYLQQVAWTLPFILSNENHELSSHNFVLFTVDEDLISTFNKVVDAILIDYANAQDIDEFTFSINNIHCPHLLPTTTHDSCLIHLLPLKEDRTCLVKPPHSPSRKEVVFQGKLEEVEIYEFISVALGFSFDSLNITIQQYQPTIMEGEEELCQRIKLSELTLEMMISNYWLFQKPLVIEQFFNPVNRVRLEYLLTSVKQTTLGAKLSFDGEYEGVDDVHNWEMSEIQSIPLNILKQLESPELVVVRPAHQEITIAEFLDNLKKKSNAKKYSKWGQIPLSSFNEYQYPNIYVEYLAIQDRELLTLVKQLMNLEMESSENLIQALSKNFSFLKYPLNGNAYLWLGDGHTIGKLHFDPFDNLLLQVEGSKIFRLIDPLNNVRMYEGHMREAMIEALPEITGNRTTGRYKFRKRLLLESTSMVHSPLDINLLVSKYKKNENSLQKMKKTKLKEQKEQLERYPNSKDILTLDCQVNKGDALWLPSFWWHEVTSLPGSQDNYNNGDYNGDYNNDNGDDGEEDLSPLNIAVNIWFDPLFHKEYPCKECPKKKVNQLYAPILKELFRNRK